MKSIWHREINLMEFSGLLVGAFLATCIIVLSSTAFLALREHGWGVEEYKIYCYFDKGLGLRNGTKIQVNGVDVGRVSNIELTTDGRVRLEFTIRTMYKQHITTTSIIHATRDQNLISERIINIGRGELAGRVLEDGDELHAGTAQDIETVLEHVLRLLDRIDRIAIAADTLFQMAMDPQTTIGALVGSRHLYDQIHNRIGEVGDITRKTTGLLDYVNTSLPLILDRTDSLTRNIVTVAEDLTVLSGKANEMMVSLDSTVYSLNLMLGDLKLLARNANHLMMGGEEKLERIDELVGSLNKFWIIRNRIPDKDTIPAMTDGLW